MSVYWRLKREGEGGEGWHLDRDFERGGKKNKRKVGRGGDQDCIYMNIHLV